MSGWSTVFTARTALKENRRTDLRSCPGPNAAKETVIRGQEKQSTRVRM